MRRTPLRPGPALRLAELPVHISGLRLMERCHEGVQMRCQHRVPLPECCPISHNPLAGSALTLTYRPRQWVLEVYGLRTLVGRFRGGFPGVGPYPPERNMEGMIQLLAQMSADAVGVPVHARADLVLDTGGMVLTAYARPCDV